MLKTSCNRNSKTKTDIAQKSENQKSSFNLERNERKAMKLTQNKSKLEGTQWEIALNKNVIKCIETRQQTNKENEKEYRKRRDISSYP